MKRLINITNLSGDMDRFANKKDLTSFYRKRGLDGVELMFVGDIEIPCILEKGDIVGVHLNFPPSWYDFWKGNIKELKRQFGKEEDWMTYYGGRDGEILVQKLKKELEIADQLKVRYVVFHVSESSLEECITYKFRYTDVEIANCAIEIVNQILEHQTFHFDFLVENLWWSGFTMTDPFITQMLMEKIKYERKGIMFDLGHVLHTNNALQTQSQAVEYISQILDRNGNWCRYIKGVHLHQSLSGAYVEESLSHPCELKGSFNEKLGKVYEHIFQIDSHRPFTDKCIVNLIHRINPEYLTLELISRNREEHTILLEQQLAAIAE